MIVVICFLLILNAIFCLLRIFSFFICFTIFLTRRKSIFFNQNDKIRCNIFNRRNCLCKIFCRFYRWISHERFIWWSTTIKIVEFSHEHRFVVYSKWFVLFSSYHEFRSIYFNFVISMFSRTRFDNDCVYFDHRICLNRNRWLWILSTIVLSKYFRRNCWIDFC